MKALNIIALVLLACAILFIAFNLNNRIATLQDNIAQIELQLAEQDSINLAQYEFDNKVFLNLYCDKKTDMMTMTIDKLDKLINAKGDSSDARTN